MEKITRALEGIIKDIFGVEKKVELSSAPDGVGAEFATNVAMSLAREVGKKPREIAEEIRTKFLEESEKEKGLFEGTTVEVVGPGFLNFCLGQNYYKKVVQEMAGEFADYIRNEQYKGKNVVTEFSDPNPFKVLHVGHLYTSVMGESISRLVSLAGGEVHRVNFGGDVGLHVGKTMYELEKLGKDEFSIEEMAECYVRGTRAYDEDEAAREKIIELNKKVYQIAEKGQDAIDSFTGEDRKLAERYWKGRELSYKYFVQFYDRIGVEFEKFYPESSVAGEGVKRVREAEKKGIYEESEGAVVFKGEKYGLHTRVFINKEGVPTYETKDVGLLFTKDKDYHFDESIVITGNEQSEYMRVVLKSVEQYAPELVQKTKHITHGMVRLAGDEKMSSRKGNFIKAVDVLNKTKKMLEEKGNGEAGNNEIIMLGAIKYAFLKYKIGGNIVFNAEESISTTGNSGVYLLYSAVRAGKILGKAQREENGEENKDWELNEYEKRLSRKFMEYPEVLDEAVSNLAPHIVANYLFGLAQEFSRFYENCRVVGDEFEQERMRLVLVFKNIIEHGLGVLGIEIPEEM